MAEWITDRLPTEADANRLENVKIKTYFGQSPENGFDCHYSCIVLGQPWWSPNAAANPAPAAEPAPATVERKVRKVDQIAVLPESENVHPIVFALYSDDTIWGLPLKGRMPISEDWFQLPPIPQPEAK
jgi:hypothetical protein